MFKNRQKYEKYDKILLGLFLTLLIWFFCTVLNFSSITGEATIETEDEFKKLKNIGTMIGEDCTIGSNVVVDPGVIIGRRCRIDSLKKISKNIPSESKVM